VRANTIVSARFQIRFSTGIFLSPLATTKCQHSSRHIFKSCRKCFSSMVIVFKDLCIGLLTYPTCVCREHGLWTPVEQKVTRVNANSIVQMFQDTVIRRSILDHPRQYFTFFTSSKVRYSAQYHCRDQKYQNLQLYKLERRCDRTYLRVS